MTPQSISSGLRGSADPSALRAKMVGPMISLPNKRLDDVEGYPLLVRLLLSSGMVFLSVLFWYLNASLTVAGGETLFHIHLFIDVWGWALAAFIGVTSAVEALLKNVFKKGTPVEVTGVFAFFAGADIISTFIGLLPWFNNRVFGGHAFGSNDTMTWAICGVFSIAFAFLPERLLRYFVWLLLHTLGLGRVFKAFA